MSEPSLDYWMRSYGTDKQQAQHGYAEWYERHLGRLRHDPIRLLEVGIYEGASLRAWADYFPTASIVGVDIMLRARIDHPRIQQIRADVNHWTPEGTYDVIIDDGSHMASDIVAAWSRLWLALRPGGWYVIEDLETQWDRTYQGHPDESLARALLRKLLDDSIREEAGMVAEMHAYRQIVFLRKVDR